MEQIRVPLDTALTRETPEGIALELRPAGIPARAAAFIVDQLIRIVLLIIVSALATLMGRMGAGLMALAFFLLEWLYPVVFELSRGGATPGKSIFGLRVVMDSGLPVTPGASLARNLLRAADFMPIGYGLGLLFMLTRPDFRRVGDIAAGTLVVHEQPPPLRGDLPQVEPLPPAIRLGQREQATLVALAARAPTLTVERLNELAAIAAPATGEAGASGPALTQRVLGVAQWLLGRRQ